MINRQCPECGGYEMDDGTSDLCYCYEVGSDECDTLKADLDRHKRAVERAKEMLGTVTTEDIGPQLIAELTRLTRERDALAATEEGWRLKARESMTERDQARAAAEALAEALEVFMKMRFSQDLKPIFEQARAALEKYREGK